MSLVGLSCARWACIFPFGPSCPWCACLVPGGSVLSKVGCPVPGGPALSLVGLSCSRLACLVPGGSVLGYNNPDPTAESEPKAKRAGVSDHLPNSELQPGSTTNSYYSILYFLTLVRSSRFVYLTIKRFKKFREIFVKMKLKFSRKKDSKYRFIDNIEIRSTTYSRRRHQKILKNLGGVGIRVKSTLAKSRTESEIWAF